MAMNVFGTPITNLTLAGIPEYADEEISQRARATVALSMKNANGNDHNVLRFVENVAKNSGSDITTRCVVYNATGDTITFVTSHDWWGGLAESPYPVMIANGQWGGFVHVKPNGRSGSHAAVVYRGKNEDGEECDWMMCWRNAFDRNCDNTAYTEIREKDHFPQHWKYLENVKDNAQRTTKDIWHKCASWISTGSGYKAVVEAIFTLENV